MGCCDINAARPGVHRLGCQGEPWKSDAKPPAISTEELLAALRATPPRPELPKFKDAARAADALMRYFLFKYLLLKKPARRGNECGTPSIQVCSLYRLYRDWHLASLDYAPMTPRQFSLALGRAGIKRRRVFRQDEQYWLLVFVKEGSRRLIAWLEENPDPYTWPQEFAKQVGPRKHETTSPR